MGVSRVQAGRRTRMTFEPRDYLAQLEGFEMSEQEKLAFIESLRSILTAFIEEAWGLDAPLQAANDNEPLDEKSPQKSTK